MTEGLFPEPLRVRHKERGGRWGHASPFMRGSTIVRSQTFSPGARSQYVCRVSPPRFVVILGEVLFVMNSLGPFWKEIKSSVSYIRKRETLNAPC